MKNKPSWARYKASNKDGFYYFYAYAPKPSSQGWVCGGIKARVDKRLKPVKHEKWYTTLETL